MLTKRQHDILAYIETFLKAKGYSPSLSDIAEHMRIRSVSTVHKHLRNLEARGVIHRGRGSRSIQVVERRIRRDHEITLLGTLTEKPPIHSTPTPTTLIIPPSMQRERSDLFALQVTGDGLHSEGLRHGDYVICEERHSPDDGDMVLAILQGKRMVYRRYHTEEQREDTGVKREVRLVAEHSATEALLVPAASVQVQGIVVGLIREY